MVFFWQPPHFWALAIKYRDDYRSAGIPMLPVVASVRRVMAESVVYSWLMVAASLAVWPWAGPLYGGVAIVAGAAFLYEVHRLFHLSRQADADGQRQRRWSGYDAAVPPVAGVPDGGLRRRRGRRLHPLGTVNVRLPRVTRLIARPGQRARLRA